MNEVDRSLPPISTESVIVDLSDIKEDYDGDTEVIVSTDSLDEYVSALNLEAFISETRESAAHNSSALGRIKPGGRALWHKLDRWNTTCYRLTRPYNKIF